jgi:hypothetical protein
MAAQSDALEVTDGACEDTLTATRRGVMERMADPYLTDHDRWVLRQFANFLGRLTPDPYPRSMAIGTEGPLPPRARRRRV